MNVLLGSSWFGIKDGDLRSLGLYMRHYSSKKARWRKGLPIRRRGRSQTLHVGPGEKLLLLTRDGRACFAWRYSVFRKDGQEGVENTLFRNEGERRSSDLIRDAVWLAREHWPGIRLFTYVDPREVRRLHKRHIHNRPVGYCFLKAGWLPVPNVGAKWIWEASS